MTSFRLDSIVPDSKTANREGYFRYEGSLTTPPCTQGVTWLIFEYKISISQKQVYLFWLLFFGILIVKKYLYFLLNLKMESFYKNAIKLNYREVQSLGSRKLYISKSNSEHVSFLTRVKKAFDIIFSSIKDAFYLIINWKINLYFWKKNLFKINENLKY